MVEGKSITVAQWSVFGGFTVAFIYCVQGVTTLHSLLLITGTSSKKHDYNNIQVITLIRAYVYQNTLMLQHVY